eukprot:11164850-Lingulodinium_polyedra.AAC.1
MASARYHRPTWHLKLLMIIHVGLRQGVYKSCQDSPLWTGPKTTPMPATEDKEEDQQEVQEAAAAAQVVRAAAASSSASRGPGEEAEKGPVRQEEPSAQAIRDQCKNTLYAAAQVLSMQSVFEKTCLIATLVKPLFDFHPRNAAE